MVANLSAISFLIPMKVPEKKSLTKQKKTGKEKTALRNKYATYFAQFWEKHFERLSYERCGSYEGKAFESIPTLKKCLSQLLIFLWFFLSPVGDDLNVVLFQGWFQQLQLRVVSQVRGEKERQTRQRLLQQTCRNIKEGREEAAQGLKKLGVLLLGLGVGLVLPLPDHQVSDSGHFLFFMLIKFLVFYKCHT